MVAWVLWQEETPPGNAPTPPSNGAAVAKEHPMLADPDVDWEVSSGQIFVILAAEC